MDKKRIAALLDHDAVESKSRARRFGRQRDKKIAMLLTRGGSRRQRAMQIAQWSIEQMFPFDEEEPGEWQEQRSLILRRAATLVSRNAPESPLAREAEFVAASSHAISLAAAALGLLLAFVTERDGSVCSTCREAEQEGPYDEAEAPRPPLHPHCRCVLHPVLR